MHMNNVNRFAQIANWRDSLMYLMLRLLSACNCQSCSTRADITGFSTQPTKTESDLYHFEDWYILNWLYI